MKKPNFFILGAPKCGTSSIYKWLSDSPQVYTSLKKEPMFFNTDMERRTKSLDEYERLFAQANEGHKAIGEASTWYLYSDEAVTNILRYIDKPKFIVCLRNPLEMAPSLHWHCYRNGYEEEKKFRKAWSLQEKRRNGMMVPKSCFDPSYLQYGLACKLGKQLDRLLGKVNRENILTIFLEDIAANPEKEFRSVLKFLDLQDFEKKEFKAKNYAYRSKFNAIRGLVSNLVKLKKLFSFQKSLGILNWIEEKNREPFKRPEISLDTKKMLLEYFKNDINKLERLLDRNLKPWTEINSK